jgi:DNA (cytosine-5)-methyltransferase 1
MLFMAPAKLSEFTFADLFAGIGGIRLAFEEVGGRCCFTSEWDPHARRTYSANFRDDHEHVFAGDITKVDAREVPRHDVLLAGFPCQPFSIAGVSKKNSLGRSHGFADETQGTLFFDIARIIEARRPKAILLENVKNLASHDMGRTFEIIRKVLENDLGYNISFEVMDARNWVPQGRQRILIVGFDRRQLGRTARFDFARVTRPSTRPLLKAVLHPESGRELAEPPYTEGAHARVASKYILSNHLWRYLRDYAEKHRRAGNGFGFGLVDGESVARTLSARYFKDGSEILVSRGPRRPPRRLTPRECARLMGFPDSFVIPVSDTQAYRQFGNSVVVPMLTDVAQSMVAQLQELENSPTRQSKERGRVSNKKIA